MTDTRHPSQGQPLPPTGPLPFRDTHAVYGRMSRFLHWTIAILVIWQLLWMGLGRIFEEHPVVETYGGFHAQIGTILFVLIVIRALWALSNRNNRPGHGTHFFGRAASLGHALIYVVLLAIPTVALIRAYGSQRVFAPFGFTIFPAQEPPIKWMTDLGGALHGELGWLLAILIVGHVAMVGVHESMWRDGTLARMLGRRRGSD